MYLYVHTVISLLNYCSVVDFG